MRLACAAFPLVLLVTGDARAQSAGTTLSESEFIEQYRTAEPRFAGLEADVMQSRAKVQAVRTLKNPQVYVQRESAGGVNENFAGLNWSLNLGGRGARIDSARSGVSAAKERLAHARLGLELDALVVYYTAVFARARGALLLAARAPLAETVAMLRKQAAAGETAGYDRDRLELELARYDQELANARTADTLAGQAVAALLGRDDGKVIATGSRVVGRPAPLPSLVSRARDRRFDIRAAKHRATAAKLAKTAAGRWWIPTVLLSGGIKTVSGPGQDDTGYIVSATVGVPLFNRRTAASQQATASLVRERANFESASRTASAEVRRAHTSLLARLDGIADLDKEQMPRARRLVTRARLLYREGEGSAVKLIDAHRTALQVELRRLELEHQAKRDQLDLWRAMGAYPSGGKR